MKFDWMIGEIGRRVDRPVADFSIQGAVTDEPVPFAERQRLPYREFKKGDSWGSLFSCAWFRLEGWIDPSLVDDRLYLELDMNCEALLFNEAGVPVQGFTNGSSAFGFLGSLGSPVRRNFPLARFVAPDGNVVLWIDAGMNDLFGNVKRGGRIELARMVTRDRQAWELLNDLECLIPLARAARKRDREAFVTYRRGLGGLARVLRGKEGDWMGSALAISKRLLGTPTKANHDVSSIGHAHLDLAWLWPIRETRRKGARTFANALRLMEEYPDYRFGASQPQLYAWVKEDHPALYEELRKRVLEGRWEVQGGMWVEADTNLTGEESLVRQLLHGIRFFKREFGVRVDGLWLPDVFGYSGNIPQLMRKSGLDRFMTIKINWNDTTTFPHHSFNWEGIDGSTVLAHMPPEGEYNSPADVRWLQRSMERYRERAIDNRTLNLFGVGDGGGGPTAGHVERIRRLGGAAPLPRVRMETSKEFFDRLMTAKDRLPTYRGELYLEKHRGTYTSQGRVKSFNRSMERKLKTLEILLVHAGAYARHREELGRIWEEVLLYQFHDILPGSSINRVYKECLERYVELDRRIDAMVAEVLGVWPDKAGSVEGAGELAAYNPLPTEASVDWIDGHGFHELRVAPLSARVLERRSWKREGSADVECLENAMLRVTLDRDGSIRSIFDKEAGREVLKGRSNQLRSYPDFGNAWDILRHYRLLPSRPARLVKAEAFTYGPVKEIVQRFVLGKSEIVLTIRLKPDSRRLDFDLAVEWRGHRRMLRAAFPLALKTDRAAFDIQFGHLYRSTRNDSEAERAQYEVPAQNWADMGDGRHGAAIITDSKHGYRAKGSTLDLDLIRSTNHPAKRGDIGSHVFRYTLYVHQGDLVEARVDAVAMEFNSWMPHFRQPAVGSLDRSLFELDNEAIACSCVKGSEDRADSVVGDAGDAGEDIVIRLYERHGAAASCRLKLDFPAAEIYETDLLEENPFLLARGRELALDFKPFEIRTLRVRRERTERSKI